MEPEKGPDRRTRKPGRKAGEGPGKGAGDCLWSPGAGQWAGAATASGTRPRENRTIAVDKRLIPLGTKVQIGKETYVAEDTGGAIKGKKIDVYYSSHGKAMSHGVKYQKIKVYI